MKLKSFLFLGAFFALLGTAVFATGQKATGTTGGLTIITMTQVGVSSAGVQSGLYWTDILAEDVGVRLDLVTSSPETMLSMLAARNFPELVVANYMAVIDPAIKADLFLDLDEYRAKLPNVYANAGQGMMQYMRDNFSNGTGKLLAIRGGAGAQNAFRGSNNLGPYLRWDWYKELGMPPINDLEDYLSVLKAMVDRHPTNEAGQKIYGVSIWSNWDGGTYMMVPAMHVSMLGKQVYGYSTEVDLKTGAAMSTMDDRSAYKRGVKWLFTANQMGLLDPDSITQGWDNFLEKGTAGRNLYSYQTYGFGQFNTSARQAQGEGFRLVPFKNMQAYNAGAPMYTGGQTYYMISKKNSHLDKILEFMNYVWSVDGAMQLYNGRKGVAWDVDSNGEPYFTELGWKLKTDTNAEFPNGGKWGHGFEWATNEPALAIRTIHPTYKRTIGGDDWIKKDFAPADTALVADWKKTMNAEDDMDYLIKNNLLVNQPFVAIPEPPEDIQIIVQRVGAIIQPGCWRAVYAKDEAEFNAIWNQTVIDAKAVGLDRITEWYAKAYADAKAVGAKYMK